MLVNYNLNNLSGGISQQQPELRFDNQVEDMVNFTITNSEGLVRRNPTKSVIENIDDGFTVDTPIHSYTGSDGISYGMYLYYDNATSETKIRVFNTDGVEKTVVFPMTGYPIIPMYWILNNYIQQADIKKSNIQFLTVGDTTWILNKNRTVSKTIETGYEYSKNKAFYWVKRSFDDGQGKGYDYLVKLKLKASSTWKTVKVKNIVETQTVDPATDTVITVNTTTYNVPNATTTLIGASLIASVINGGNQGTGGEDWTGWSAKLVGSVVRITAPSNAEFDFESGDSWGNQASFGWTNEVPKITDLPADMRGFTTEEVGTISITGSTKNEFTNYYVVWNGTSWKEDYKRGELFVIDVTTLPIVIQRQSNESFKISYMPTNNSNFRRVGDEESNPFPSFVGSKISNIFFFKDRLGFTSDENVCLSETSVYGNFFATTVMEVLDSDPIDVTIDSNTVSNIRNVTASGGALTLWSDNAQFLLAGGEVLSPATTRISQTSSYSCDNNIPPIVVDNEVLFVSKKGTYSELMAYSPASLQADKSSAESLMAHLPRFIKSDIVSLVASPEHNMVFMLTASEPQTIYVYKYLVQGNQKVMSSFFKWTFASFRDIKGIICLAGNLYMIINDNLLYKDAVHKVMLEHKFNNDSTDYEDKGGVELSAYVVLSKQNIKSNQGSYVFTDKFYIKNIQIKCNSYLKVNGLPNVSISVYNTLRGQDIVNPVGILDINNGVYIGSDADVSRITISIPSGNNSDVNIQAINITGMINHKSKNI